MNRISVFSALLLGLIFSSNASAELLLPDSPNPSTQPPALSSPPAPQTPDATKPAAAPQDDEIIVIAPPRIGKAEAQKAEPTPEMFELLYKMVWLKVSQEYQDPSRLRDWDQWQHKFDGKLKSETELDSAVKELLGSLKDRWTNYYSRKDIEEQAQAQKDGVCNAGMLLRRHNDNAWHIDNIQFNSAAMRTPLREGDVIKALNGKDLAQATAADVSKALHGKQGEKVSVLAIYDGAEHTVEISFAPQGANEVVALLLPGKIAYIRLPTFVSPDTVQEFIGALAQLYEESHGQIEGLIFDLRHNGGGLVQMALTVSSLFLEDGTITTTTTRTDRSLTQTHYKVIPAPAYLLARMPEEGKAFQQFLHTVPLVVLTNGSTASASEITTSALKDNGRAFVIGGKTFGKAVGFTKQALPNGALLQVTNLTYLTPNGSDIADKGITPDQEVVQPRGEQILGEHDLQLQTAHAHLFAAIEQRHKEFSEAQELATKEHQRAQAEASRQLLSTPLCLALMAMSLGIAALTLGFALRKRK
jgi:carboxyl-terminal processing protease